MLQNAMPALLLLALMVGLAFALKWARRRLPGIAGHSGPALRVLSSLSLGPQQRVVTVQVGDGAERICLVLGVASGSVTALHQMPLPAELPVVPADPTAPAASFAARLTQLMKAPHAPR